MASTVAGPALPFRMNARAFVVKETSDAMIDFGQGHVPPSFVKAVLDCQQVDLETDHRGALPEIGIPTLIIHGDEDVSAPLERTGRRTAQLMPGSRRLVYEGARTG